MALMPPYHSHYTIALEKLREIQRQAAEKGHEITFYFHNFDGSVASKLPPPAITPREEEGIHVLAQQRVGDEVKQEYYDRLHEAFVGGFIDSGELDARLDAALKCTVREGLDRLVQDIPKVEKKKEIIEIAPKQPGKFLAGRFDWLTVSVMTGICAVISLTPPFSPSSLIAFVVLIACSVGALIANKYKR